VESGIKVSLGGVFGVAVKSMGDKVSGTSVGTGAQPIKLVTKIMSNIGAANLWILKAIRLVFVKIVILLLWTKNLPH